MKGRTAFSSKWRPLWCRAVQFTAPLYHYYSYEPSRLGLRNWADNITHLSHTDQDVQGFFHRQHGSRSKNSSIKIEDHKDEVNKLAYILLPFIRSPLIWHAQITGHNPREQISCYILLIVCWAYLLFWLQNKHLVTNEYITNLPVTRHSTFRQAWGHNT